MKNLITILAFLTASGASASAKDSFELCYSRRWLTCDAVGSCSGIAEREQKMAIELEDGMGNAFVRMKFEGMENDVQIDVTERKHPTEYTLTISTGGTGVSDSRHLYIRTPSDAALNHLEIPVGIFKKGARKLESSLAIGNCER